ncbi:MAG: epimerase [Coriobacteriaceae bacterium]|nr:epimerase [Coriobacteriaceae bacterium]
MQCGEGREGSWVGPTRESGGRHEGVGGLGPRGGSPLDAGGVAVLNLVTGGSGFLGTHLARRLLARGEGVRVLDPAEPASDLRGRVEWVAGSVLDPGVLAEACRSRGIVFHTAALVPLAKAGRRFDDVNVRGTRNVADVCVAAGIRRLVHVSSSAVYDPAVTAMPITEQSPLRPVGRYGRSKRAAELEVVWAGERGLEWAIVRPRTIVDEGRGGIFQILFDWVLAGRSVYTIGDGSNAFQLVSASDLAEACCAAAVLPEAAGETFNVGAEEFGMLDELMRDLVRHAGTGSRVVHLNAPLARAALGLLDAVCLSPLADWHYKTMDKPFWFSNAKARRVLGWAPKDSNRVMMVRAFEWYVRHRDEIDSQAGTTHRTSPPQGILRLLRWWS